MATFTTKPKESTGLMAVSCKRVLGADVDNLQGKHLGSIQDLAIDWQAGCIAYAVLAFPVFMGVSRKLFAIPWGAFSLRDREGFMQGASNALVLNIPEEALKSADGFDEHNWPSAPDYDWLQGIYERYGFKPYWDKP